MKHYSVMLQEAITYLHICSDGIYVDATLGYGGHSEQILKKITSGFLYSFDQDKEAIQYAKERLRQVGTNFKLIHSNFVDIQACLEKENITLIDGILFDLGVSSPQIDTQSRGFSFMKEAKLDMRMDLSSSFTAYDVINTYTKEKLLFIFYSYGEEQKSKQIVDSILQERKKKKIETTTELVQIIQKSVGEKYFYLKHPERQIFQAIRIEVNHELQVLEEVLPKAISLLKKGGRMCVITFHSLEDRIVKHIFKKYSEVDEIFKGLPEIPLEYQPKIKLITHKPILASSAEISENSRSKSAKLRVIERI